MIMNGLEYLKRVDAIVQAHCDSIPDEKIDCGVVTSSVKDCD